MGIIKLAFCFLHFTALLFALKLHAQTSHNVALPKSSYIQSYEGFDLKENYKYLGLKEAVSQGLSKNFSQIKRDYDREILELNWKDTKQAFWLPNVSINFTTEKQRIGRLKKGNKSDVGSPDKAPSGTLSLEIEDYTIFNWGKDYINYLNRREEYIRNKTKLSEDMRKLKHSLLTKYFELSKFYAIRDSFKQQLRHASFVYRINREKSAVKKVSKEDYYLARTEYLRTQSNYHQAIENAMTMGAEMARMIADNSTVRYILKHRLDYKKIKISLKDVLEVAEISNPSILEHKKDMENAQRSYRLSMKENLPLPKISVNLGAYNHRFKRGENSFRYETAPNNSNIDMVASIKASWNLVGQGGILNMRNTNRSRIKKHSAFNQHAEAIHDARSQAENLFHSIKSLENQITILEARQENIQKIFDIILDSYLKKKSPFNQYRDILHEKTNVEISLTTAKFEHMKNKIALAGVMGVDDLRGDIFEQQIKEVKVR